MEDASSRRVLDGYILYRENGQGESAKGTEGEKEGLPGRVIAKLI
jgi:hypothetical protein